MRSSRSRSARVRVWYARAVLVVLLTLGVSTLDHYADAGEGEKDCLVQVRPASPEVVQRIDAPFAGLVQRGGTVNDASCVNAVAVHGVVRPRTVREESVAVLGALPSPDMNQAARGIQILVAKTCLLYTSPSPRDS